MLVPVPSTLSFRDAATTPTVFITGKRRLRPVRVAWRSSELCSLPAAVEMALSKVAAVAASDRVLIHAAAGGVGLAAIQLVQAHGASAVATAGGPAKRSLVHSLGVSGLLGSRDTMFVSELAEVVGASVALNSLTSSGMVAGSLAALDAGGRFVEISKRDIWSAARVAQGAGTSCWVSVH